MLGPRTNSARARSSHARCRTFAHVRPGEQAHLAVSPIRPQIPGVPFLRTCRLDTDQERQWESIKRALVILGLVDFQTPRLQKRRAQLETEAEKIHALIVAQDGPGNRKRGGSQTRQLRVNLRKHPLKPLSRDGKLFLAGMPGIKDMLRLPHERIADSNLIEAARRIVDNVKPHEATFIDAGYRIDFIARAEQAIAALEARAGQPDERTNRTSRATASLPKALVKGREIIGAVDGIVDDELADNPGARDMWKKAKRLHGKIGRPKNNWRPQQKPLPGAKIDTDS